MSKKRLIVKNRKRKQAYFAIFFVLFLVFGLGYASMGTSLGLAGSLEVSKFDRTLYSAFRREVTKGYAMEYTGLHQDSLTGSGSERIYYWYATSDGQGMEILNRNNVIFANQCWQMMRTTDTGGVKILYNGEVEDGKCLDTRNTHIGYNSVTSKDLSGTYYYATSYHYDYNLNYFTLAGDMALNDWNDTNAPNIIGKYTCLRNSAGEGCSTLYLVDSYLDSNTANVISLGGGSHFSQYGMLPMNASMNSIAYSGYMYNSVYPSLSGFGQTETVLYQAPISKDYWYFYGNSDYVVDPDTGDAGWTFSQSMQLTDADDPSILVGKYTFQSSDINYNNPTVQYIMSVEGDTYYYVNLVEGGQRDRYFFGDTYLDNGDGTSRIVAAMTVDASNWNSNYGRLKGKYVCKNSQACSDVMYVTAANETQYSYSTINSIFKYGNSFTYDGSDYTLVDTVEFWNIGDTANTASLSTHHYTCFNDSGTCSTIYYIHYVNGSTPYYIPLTGGNDAPTALSEMLSNSGVNQKSSTMKNGIDAWYRHFLSGYDSYLEDVVYCGDRRIMNLNGWEPNGGSVTVPLQFQNASVSNDLSCGNVTDKFSVSNASAPLTYKVGMATSSEINIYNNPYATKSTQFYWSMSPKHFGDGMVGHRIDYDGILQESYTSNLSGVRPVVSLIPGIEFVSGDGTMESPYVIETN